MSSAYRELRAMIARYRSGEYGAGEQFARLDLVSYCQRHGIRRCFRCGRIEWTTIMGHLYCGSCELLAPPTHF